MRTAGAMLAGLLVIAVIMGFAVAVDSSRTKKAEPAPIPKPKCPNCPTDAVALIGGPAPDGTEPTVDFPDSQWMRNIGSKLDGAGMCVFTSFEHAARWTGLEDFRGFRDWCAQHYRGGGYPEKLAKLVEAYSKAKGFPAPAVVQYEGADPSFLERALRNDWLPCVTLYSSPRYGSGRIYHMVNCPHLDSARGAILDNNFRPYEWASRDETLRRVKLNGRYWAVAIVQHRGQPVVGPPPTPKL